MKRILTVGLVGVIVGLVIYQWLHKDIWDVNRDLLKTAVIEMEDSEPVKLSDVTPFDWDYVYSFTPYVSKDQVYEAVGYKWDTIQQTVSEGMNQLVFMKDDQVVCYVYGYAQNNGFGIYMERAEYGEPFVKLYANEDSMFKREVIEGAVVLTQLE